MWPTLYEVQTASGSIPLHNYGLFILAAFCAAFMLVHVRAQRIGLHPDKLLPVYFAAAIGGLTGGRLLYAFAVDFDRTVSDPLSLFSAGGFAVYGGILGGIVAVAAAARMMEIRPWKLADIAAPAVLLGMGIGRLGCLAAGCCHGAVAEGFDPVMGVLPHAFHGGQIWLGNEFPFVATEFAAGNGGVSRISDIPLYPTQIWAAVLLIGMAGFLSWRWEHRRFDGQIAALALMLEPLYRIVVEAFRADHRGYAVSWSVSERVASWFPSGMTQAGQSLGDGHSMGLTTSQAIGFATLAAGIAMYAARYNAGISDETPVPTTEAEADDALEDALADL